MHEDTHEIPPVRTIVSKLREFTTRVPVWGLTVFTIDGYVIAHHATTNNIPQGVEMAISSMSAGLIAIAEDFIRLVDAKKRFKEIVVDSEDTDGAPAFSVILRHAAENVMLACIFPRTTQLGLITFEMDLLCNDIVEIVGQWDPKLHMMKQ